MEFRQLGTTGIRVSAIGIGTWELGGTQYGPLDESEAVRAIHRGLDIGLNCVDTAPAYGCGHAEEVLGTALKSRRKDIVLVTKCGLDWNEQKQITRNTSRERIIGGLEESLRRLRTDYVDAYLIHWPDHVRPVDEGLAALTEVLASGKARAVGVSNFNAQQIAVAQGLGVHQVHQMGYNLFDRRVEKEIMPYCREHSVGIMIYGSLSYGLLAGAFSDKTTFVDWDWRSSGKAFGQPIFDGANFLQNLRVVDELRDVARGRGVTLAQLAMNWVIGNPAVSVALTGARIPAEIEDTIGADGWRLTADEKARIEAIMAAAAGQTADPPSSSVQKRA